MSKGVVKKMFQYLNTSKIHLPTSTSKTTSAFWKVFAHIVYIEDHKGQLARNVKFF